MNEVKAKQIKPLKVKILGTLLLITFFYAIFFQVGELYQQIVFLFLSILLLTYSIEYVIRKDFRNYKQICFFGLSIFKTSLNLDFPNYISVFSISQSSENEWGAISAIGTKEQYEMTVVRFFSANNKYTVFKSNNYNQAYQLAVDISKLISVEIYDATKD